MGRRAGFDLVVSPQLEIDGRSVRSSDIRAAIAAGDLGTAARLLGRPYAIVGSLDVDGLLRPTMPVALPPTGSYPASLDGGAQTTVDIADGEPRVGGDEASRPIGPVRIVLETLAPA
jgi:hypothetical protein